MLKLLLPSFSNNNNPCHMLNAQHVLSHLILMKILRDSYYYPLMKEGIYV